MRRVIFKNNIYGLLTALLILGLAACKKDHANLVGGTGAPVITSVATAGKSVTDTTVTITTTYDENGVPTTKVDTNKAHNSVVPFDSTTTEGKKQNLYVIKGKNLGSATQVLFNGVSAYFNTALVSDNTIIVSIPSNIPTGPDQSNTLTVITLHGKVDFKFTVLTPPPTVSKVSDYDFVEGSQITLTGVSFSTVTAITVKGTTATATIVSKVDTQMVIKMPATSISRANLVFTYASGTATSAQEFVDLDNNYMIFAKNDFQNGWFDNSWSHPSGASSEASHSGTASIRLNYPAGAWQIEGWADWNTPGKFAYNPDYKYLTFWVKGGTVAHTLYLVGDQMDGGYSQNTSPAAAAQIAVPAKVWTYFKIPLGAPSSNNANLLNFWKNGTPAQQLGFFLQGQSGDVDEVMYMDEVAFIK